MVGMQPLVIPRLERTQIVGVSCPPKGAIGQAIPKGTPMQLVIAPHPETGNPMALDVRNHRATSHRSIPIRCDPWLSAGTIVAGTVVSKNKSEWYVFHDIVQIGGRWLRDASHRERLGTLVGFLQTIDTDGMGVSFCLATMLPESDGVLAPAHPTAKEMGYAVRQVQHKVLSETKTVYVVGSDAQAVVPTRGQRPAMVLSTRGPAKPGATATSPPLNASHVPKPVANAPAPAPAPAAPKRQRANKRTGPNGESVLVTAGDAGPDDYTAADQTGKRAGPLRVCSMSLSLKLNQLLRGTHYDLYRPTGSRRVLPKMSLACVWETKNQCWRPCLELEGTKVKAT
jgi:hypothetical protein